DPQTFRPRRVRTEPFSQPEALSYQPAGSPLQDVAYEYDLVGNVLRIVDVTSGSGMPNNPDALSLLDAVLRERLASGDALRRGFEYDPLYRLVSASGRECDVPADAPPWTDPRPCADPTRAQAYTE